MDENPVIAPVRPPVAPPDLTVNQRDSELAGFDLAQLLEAAKHSAP
jgi:hypothetical protein